MQEFSWASLLLRYFFHGLLFSVLFLVLGVIWVFILAVLVVVGLFIGFIIGLLVLFFIIGGLNAFLTVLIWNVPIKSDWKSLLVHGFVLFIVLLIAAIPSLAINFIVPSLVTTIVLFIIYCFIDGFLARRVASLWRD